MNDDDRKYVAAAINYFWTDLATPNNVNERAARVVYEALSELQSCTDSMHLVPRPTLNPGISYVVKQVVNIGRRVMSGNASAYIVCRDRVALNYRTPIRLALRGL
ncbi:hypothetical protein [Marinobacter oulmenensis]|uniref:Uncharacterized protein n=1 Tax=Marinobacter oulmenensis TaxID=643747 RepID=A0A840UHB9_9GAMM|nr:hypothetical protein [Marinobacter oulmenensis]MBB5320198.1 hypothetical protein [Marinobacter oulmenensis]